MSMAESFLKRACKKLGEAEGYVKSLVPSCPESILASQECIELSARNPDGKTRLQFGHLT